MDARHEQNRRSWNHATRAHNSHKGDQAAFLRAGGSTLFPEERELLGDVRGRRLVHLQCNAGQDSLSTDAAIPARFERADVIDFLEQTPDRFDVAFASYGALCWMSDLPRWARGVARVLAPGGRLVVVEFHPVLYLVDDDGRVGAGPTRGGGGAPIDVPTGIGDYVADSAGALPAGEHQPGVIAFTNPEPCHEWEWSVADVVDAVAQAGLRVERVREWPYSNGCRFFPTMRALPGNRWAMPADAPPIPLMYAVTATR